MELDVRRQVPVVPRVARGGFTTTSLSSAAPSGRRDPFKTLCGSVRPQLPVCGTVTPPDRGREPKGGSNASAIPVDSPQAIP